MSKVRSRRGFLGVVGSVLGFGAFEARCMVEAGVSSPTALAQDVKYYRLVMNNSSECLQYMICCTDKLLLDKMAILWTFDSFLNELYYDDILHCWQYENVCCSGLMYEIVHGHGADSDKSWAKWDRKALQILKKYYPELLTHKDYPPNRPDEKCIRAILTELQIEPFTVEELIIDKTQLALNDPIKVVFKGSENFRLWEL